jgi:hypothetical protein
MEFMSDIYKRGNIDVIKVFVVKAAETENVKYSSASLCIL